MKLEIMVMGHSDFVIKNTPSADPTAPTKTSVNFRCMVKDPMNMLTVSIPQDQLGGNQVQGKDIIDRLLKKAGQFQDVFVDYRNLSFGNDDGKHVSIQGFVFSGFIDQPK